MSWIEIVYLVCFFLGLGSAILGGLLSGAFPAAEDADRNGGGDPAPARGGSVAFSPFSPVILAMFAAGFGGAGVIFMKILEWPQILHLPAALVCGLLISAVVFGVFWRMFKGAQGAGNVSSDDAIG